LTHDLLNLEYDQVVVNTFLTGEDTRMPYLFMGFYLL